MGLFKKLFKKGNETEENFNEIIVPEKKDTDLTSNMLIPQEQPVGKAFVGDGEKGFRGNKWGASKESVINNETLQRVNSENDDELNYKTILFGMPCTVHYFFFKNKLYEGYYSIQIRAEKNEGSYDKWFNQKIFDEIPKIEFINDYTFMKVYTEVRESLCSVLGDPSKGNEKSSLWQKMLRRYNPKKNTKECVEYYLENEYELSATWDYPSTRDRLLRQISFDILNVKLDFSEVHLQIMYFFPDVAFDANDGNDFVKRIDDNIKKEQEEQKAMDDEMERQMEEVGLSKNNVLLNGFRNNKWGDTREDVYEIEESEFEYDLGNAFSYKGNQFGLPCAIFFQFDDEELCRGFYDFRLKGDLSQFIDEFKRIGSLLFNEYGEPKSGSVSNPFWRDSFRKYYGKNVEDQMNSGDLVFYATWQCGATGVLESLELGDDGLPRLGLTYYDYFKSQLKALDELDE